MILTDGQITDNFKEQMKSLMFEDVLLYDNLPEEQKLDFLKFANMIAESKAIKSLLKELVWEQILYAVQMSTSWEQDKFCRATINGYFKMQEALEKYSKMFKEKAKVVKDDFDPHKAFEPIK